MGKSMQDEEGKFFGWNGFSADNKSSLEIQTNDILSNVTYNWNMIVKNFGFYALKDEIGTINSSECDWEKFDQFSGCQIVDVTKYRTLKNKTLAQIFPTLNRIDGHGYGFTMYILEKNKITLRPIKTLTMNYAGPQMSLPDLGISKKIKLMFKLYQTISLPTEEDDESCQNYPFKGFETYGDCDADYARQIFNLYGLIPFWLANSAKEYEALLPPK